MAGYGTMSIWNGNHAVPVRAHRIAFFLAHGHWPEPETLHLCDNPPCCNPRHLREGTRMDNVRDMIMKNRQNWSGLEAYRKRGTAQQRELQALVISYAKVVAKEVQK